MATEITKRPCLLFDGAMGTYYAALNNTNVLKCELANIENPDTIAGIHAAYIAAGAEAIKTNTFAANTHALGVPFRTVEKAVRAGCRIAAHAAKKTGAFVFADFGPMPEGEAEEQIEEYRKLIDVFLDCGASAFLFETFSEYDTVLSCAAYVKERRKDSFILAQYAVSPDGYTRKGIPVQQIFHAMEQNADIDAYGLNCISGPKHIYENLKKLPLTGKPVSAMPNAGYPSVVGERTVYNFNAAYFASVLADIRSLGVKFLGGCCGTTPEHIARTRAVLGSGQAGRDPEARAARPAAFAEKAYNGFRQSLEEGRKVIAVELDPPLDTNISGMLEGSRAVREAGADIVTIADNPLARARADSALIAAKVKRECGIDTLPHIACRDRNLNALKSVVLGLHIESIRNVLAVTGDPVPEPDRSDVKAVYNFSSKMLAAYIEDLNRTAFAEDTMYIGAALNVNANRPELELKRAQEKVQNGVGFFLTQPLFSKRSVDVLKEAKSVLGAKILAGIMPLVSYRNACFVSNEVPGIEIGEETIRLFEGKTREEAEELGVAIAMQMAEEAAPYADGFYLITPLNRIEVIRKIVENIRRMVN
jgi:methionine synthase I (cobalamin-dependent)/5,10-methylenetetrahydrofolate reductase